MKRTALVALLCTFMLTGSASAQNWAQKMFKTSSHDFGDVARGSKAEYRFLFKNIYKEDVHIASVRSSCSCSDPSFPKATVPTLEEGEIVAKFNTRSFLGHKSATITVVFDKPYYAEAQLQVQGHIRGDVVFSPGVVQFGAVDQGSIAEQKVNVNYAGRSDWKILDVQSANSHIEVEMNQLPATPGRVNYELLVRLKKDAPPGYMNDRLVLVTNDARSQKIPLELEANISPDIKVSQKSLVLGDVRAGDKVTKQIIVSSKKPFKITEVDCEDDCFEFRAAKDAKILHVVAVTFTAKDPGSVTKTITIHTDRGEAALASFVAHATVKADGQN